MEVKESQMNAVSSVSGCGLAFLFLAIEAMSDGGVRVGLPRALSTDLATQAFIGAARLVQETGKHPGQVGQCMYAPNIKYEVQNVERQKRQICAKTSSEFCRPKIFTVRAGLH